MSSAEMEAYIDCEPDGRTSFTDITVSSLYPALAAKLGDMTEQLKLAQKVSETKSGSVTAGCQAPCTDSAHVRAGVSDRPTIVVTQCHADHAMSHSKQGLLIQ